MRYIVFLLTLFLSVNAYALVNWNNAGIWNEFQTSDTVDIDLDEDEVGLSITANDTQTSDLIKALDSDGTTGLFSVTGAGQMLAEGSETAPNLSFIGDDDTGFWNYGSGSMLYIFNGSRGFDFSGSSFGLRSDGDIEFSTSSNPISGGGGKITSDGAHTIALRSTTNPQNLNVYNTFTDASNYERGFVRWDTNRYEIGTEKAGTGTARDMLFMRNGEDKLRIGDTAITTVVDILPISDDTKDLGSSGSSWKDVYIDGQIINGGSAPAVSSCGTTPSITGGDTAGKVTIGSGATTSCTVTFDTAYSNAPACTVTGEDSAVTYAATTSTTALTITSSGDMSADVVMYQCIGL